MEKRVILKNERTYKSKDISIASKEILKARFLHLFCLYCIFILLVSGVFLGVGLSKNNDITFIGTSIICFLMVIIAWCFYLYSLFKIDRNNYKDVNYKYTFYEDELVIAVNSERLNQHKVLKYNDFIKCIKSENYTFLFFNKAQAFFFLNSDLNEEVYNVLKKNIKKFKD